VDDSLIDSFANAFSFDFNLQLEVHAGDVFEAAFEQAYNPSGQPVGRPSLLYVSLRTPTKSRALYRFTAPGDKEPSWFDGNGRSNVRALMMTPVDGARITSKFGPRFHPVLHYTRNHNGTDFAAPIGTPIYAAGDAVVTTASPSKCAGNMVILKHDNGWETRYFHLSRYADGLAVGERVKQGTVIGYIGVTGTCTTGPHLHFEVHIGGVPVDPLSVDTGKGKALSGAALAAFLKERDRIDAVRAGQTT
jgi:murein DD-endopeptidase MepM/ murein hydrolase activator NlpD